MTSWVKIAHVGLGVVLVAVMSVTLARGQQAPVPSRPPGSAPPGAQKPSPSKSTVPSAATSPAPAGPGGAAGEASALAPSVQRLRGTVKAISAGTFFVIDRTGQAVPLVIQPTTILSGIRSDGEKVEPQVLRGMDLKAGDSISVQYVEIEGKKLAAQVKLQGKGESSKPAKK